MVVNPEPLLKCATKTSKRPAEAQKKKGPDAKRIKKEQEAKQPGIPDLLKFRSSLPDACTSSCVGQTQTFCPEMTSQPLVEEAASQRKLLFMNTSNWRPRDLE